MVKQRSKSTRNYWGHLTAHVDKATAKELISFLLAAEEEAGEIPIVLFNRSSANNQPEF